MTSTQRYTVKRNELLILVCVVQVHNYALARLSRSNGRSPAESAAAELCALKMIMLRQLHSDVESRALRADVSQVLMHLLKSDAQI